LEIDPKQFRRRYAELSDEGLLSINRKDLTEVAQQHFDAEVAERGLLYSESPNDVKSDPDEELLLVGTFLSLEEADLVRGLLRSADIPAFLENEHTSAWTGHGGLRLMVPTSFLEQAKEVLETRISDEDLLAQAEAAAPIEPQGEERD
jgi:hypothetical protein